MTNPTNKLLIGSLTALLTARLLVAGDDPGRMRLTAGGGPLTLNLLLLVLLLAWSAWNGVRRGSTGVGGPVTFCLLAVAGLYFLSTATVAAYKRPGWFVAWEWVAVAALFCLTRRLADIPGASTGLLSAILATAISFSAVTVYQAASGPLGLPSAELGGPGVMPSLVGDEEVPEPIPPGKVTTGQFGRPFGSAETFVAFLLVLLPVVLCAGWMGLRDGSTRGFLVAGCALLAVVAFVLTVHAATSARYGSEWPLVWWRRAGGWIGVAESVGIAALLLLFAAIGLVGWTAHRASIRISPAPEAELPPGGLGANRWEFYIGGVVGLLLGFILSTGDIPAEMPPSVLVSAGVVAALRSVVWLAVFALFEVILWRPGSLIHCLLLGLGIAGLFGCVSDRLLIPPVLWTFWVVAAIVLNAGRPSSSRLARPAHPFAGWAVAPVALALLIGNLIQVAVPGLVTADAVRDARDASRHLPDQERDIAKLSGTRRQQRIWQADRYVIARVIEPLRQAARRDPDNAPLLLELARWSRLHWHYLMALHDEKSAAELSRQILQWTDRATKLDPNGAGWAGTAESLLLFVSESRVLRKERIAALEKTLDEGRNVDSMGVRYRLTQTLLDLVERRPKDPKPEDRAGLVAALDRVSTQVLRHGRNDDPEPVRSGFKLSEAQRQSLVQRLRAAIPEPSAELRDQLDSPRK